MSQRVKTFAAAGLVAVLALAGGLFFLSRGQSASPAAVPVIKPLHPVKKHQVLAAATTKTKAKAVVKAKAVTKRAKKHRSLPAVINGMPAALALALRSHSVVVVSLYAPDATVDSMAKEEASQGAAAAGAGFVALDVSNEKVAAPLTALLTGGATAADRVLDDPAVLVFRAPNTLFVRLNGWTDRDTVAQAATNAAGGQ